MMLNRKKILNNSLHNKNLKLIMIKDLPGSVEQKLKAILDEHEDLKNVLNCKIKDLYEKLESIQKKIDDIGRFEKVKIRKEVKEDVYNLSIQYISTFLDILDDVTNRCQSYNFYFSKKRPIKLVVRKSDSSDFVEYTSEQIKLMRKYVKNILNNVNVLFSRYQVKFDLEMNKLISLETFLMSDQ